MVEIIEKLIDNRQNFSLGRRGNVIKGIVLHTEASGRIEGTADRSLFNWFNTNSRRVSAHYYVTFSGKIEQYVLDNDTAHQAGNWNINLQTIGIEHQDNGVYPAGQEKYTAEQYESSARLVAHLCQKYGIPIKHVTDVSAASGITVHNEVPFASTSCPNALDWERIINRAAELAAEVPAPEHAFEPLNHPLRGLHGEGAANWMLANHVRGWAVETVYAQGDFQNAPHIDFSAHEAQGIRVILRWNHSFGTDAGGGGTYPRRELYDQFASWCAAGIQNSRGVWGHIIGNEPNRAAERPAMTVPITAADVISVYNRIWTKLQGTHARLSPPAVDPTNVETADPREYMREILRGIRGAGFFALHAISYGSDQAVTSEVKFTNAPLLWQYHSFRMWQPLAKVLRDEFAPFRSTPLIITEANHLHRRESAQQLGWDDDAGHWIHSMYENVADWNMASASQFVYGACLYRFSGDQWEIANKSGLLEAVVEAGEHAV